MKDLILNLHTAARRYCIDRASYWHQEYAKLCGQKKDRQADGYHYTDEAYMIFPRYNVLEAILPEVEKYTGYKFSSLEEEKKCLCNLGLQAESIFTKPSNDDKAGKIVIEEFKKGTFIELPIAERMKKLYELAGEKVRDLPAPKNNEIEDRVMNEERILFCDFINSALVEELQNIEPLPYRRTLIDEERKRIWGRLSKTWDIKGTYWFPLGDCSRKDIYAFLDDYFYDELGIEPLRNILLRKGIDKVWEMGESEAFPEYEIDVAAFSPEYSISGEGYWCSVDMDWIIYVSHENSITVGGEWLLDGIKAIWPNWEERKWVSWTER